MIILLQAVVLIIGFAIFAPFSLHALHMFQLNSYDYQEHRHYLKRLKLKSYQLYSKKSSSKAKKPLVFTPRLIRLIFTTYIIYFIFAIGLLVVKNVFFDIVFIIIINIASVIIPVVSNFINMPIESSVRQSFIRDAKRLLKSHNNVEIIGITGSYGKTSVKTFVAKILSTQYNVCVTPESFNTPMGLTMTIRNMLRPFHQILVCEMGAKKRGEIHELCEIVDPSIGVLTSLGLAHLESFGSEENIRSTKYELLDWVKGKNGFIVDNTNKPEYSIIKVDQNGTEFRYKDESYLTSLVGSHNIENIIIAIKIAKHFKISQMNIIKAVAKMETPPHRLEVKKTKYKKGSITVLDDAYNSNPHGAKAALDALNLFAGVKIVVTPGMVELGNQYYEANKNFGIQIANVADYVVLVNQQHTKPIYDGLIDRGFDIKRIFITQNVKDGIEWAYQKCFESSHNGKTQSNFGTVLLENDLPDNY